MFHKNFTYEEVDKEGLDTLNIIAETGNFNKWMYQTIKPFLKGSVIEIGSGIGNITQFALDDKFNITATDLRKNYCFILRSRFAGNAFLQDIRNIDIVHPDFDQEYSDLLEKFDCVFALNIIEHVEDDVLAIKNCGKLLKQNGNIIVLVPAYPALYNSFDRELKHYRRYTKLLLEKCFSQANLTIHKTQYFNLVGILGWWFSGSILSKKTIPEGQMKLFNLLVPFIKLIDKLVQNRAGLSVITFGKKL